MYTNIINSIYYHLIFKSNPSISKKLLSGRGFIFMLHRILPINEKDKFYQNKSLAISPEALQSFITEFKNLGFDFISMDNVLEYLKRKKKKKFICFTLDDGYKDNLTYGLPIFEKNNVPFTVYITNCFPNKKANHWWYHLENLINVKEDFHKEYSIFSKISSELSKYDNNKKFELLRAILLKFSPEEFKNSLSTFFSSELEKQKEYNTSICLNWNEIIDLSNHQLCTIGAHTLNHVALKHQTDEVCLKEMLDSKIEIEHKINKSVNHFCYPYGSLQEVGVREIKYAKKIGFKTAVLNHPGGIFNKHLKYPFQIPRTGLSDEIDDNRLQELFNGNLHFNFNGASKIIKLN